MPLAVASTSKVPSIPSQTESEEHIVEDPSMDFAPSDAGVKEEEPSPSQASTFTQDEDFQVRRMQDSGELREVVGSQSLLSQEIHHEFEASPSTKNGGTIFGGNSYSGLLTPAERAATEATGHLSSNSSTNNSSTSTVEEAPPLSQETMKLCATANLGSLLDVVHREIEINSNEIPFKRGSLLQQVAASPKRKFAESKKKNSEAEQSPRKKSRTVVMAPAKRTAIPRRSRSTSLSSTNSTKVVKKKKASTKHPASSASSPPKQRTSTRRRVATFKTLESPPSSPEPPSPTKTTYRRRGPVPDTDMAKQAAELAARIAEDQLLAKRLLLQMALKRTSPRNPPKFLPPPGHVLPDKFIWSHYPPLEQVLKNYMEQYYEHSINACQSAEQQQFNQSLVDYVHEAATARDWHFDPKRYRGGKLLRDRIRCYYKTHIQNAKKRLATMLRNPTKRSNAFHLIQEYDLIVETASKKEEVAASPASKKKSSTRRTRKSG